MVGQWAHVTSAAGKPRPMCMMRRLARQVGVPARVSMAALYVCEATRPAAATRARRSRASHALRTPRVFSNALSFPLSLLAYITKLVFPRLPWVSDVSRATYTDTIIITIQWTVNIYLRCTWAAHCVKSSMNGADVVTRFTSLWSDLGAAGATAWCLRFLLWHMVWARVQILVMCC